jgi:nucleoside-diphosphate-sugar epimerase
VLVLPVPRAVLFVAMLVSTLLSKIFRFKNQLDEKQYKQMAAPAFVCSSEKLRADLGFTARHDLADTLANAARGYREAGTL